MHLSASLAKKILPLIMAGTIMSASAKEKEEILVYVENNPISNLEIDRVIVSSPMADSFPTMDEKDQAGLRGDILMRLINLNLLYQESLSLGLDKTAEYQQELEKYTQGYVYKHYMDKLRAGIEVPKTVMDKMAAKLKGNSEALDAAISMYKSQQYKLVHSLALSRIKEQLHLKVYTDKLTPEITPDTIVATADDYSLRFADVTLPDEVKNTMNPTDLEEYVYRKLEIDLVNKVAGNSTDKLNRVLETFARERLPALLIQQKEAEWIPDENAAREFFKQHPTIGFEPEKRFISQIVFNDLEQAKKIQQKIKDGASFHRMAQQYSIDPVGRKNAGQLGWVTVGTGLAEIEAVTKNLQDNVVSEIIKTKLGYHLVLIEGRKLGIKRSYEEIYDQVHQAMLQANMPDYIKQLQHKYEIKFVEPVAKTYVEAQ